MFSSLLDYHFFDYRSIVVTVKMGRFFILFFVRFSFWLFYRRCAILDVLTEERFNIRKEEIMPGRRKKYDLILDSLQKLLENKNLQTISVSEIAQTAGIGKGSIYYYFPSKDAILEALVERNYEKPLSTAKNLACQTDIPPFTRMAMIFQACRNSSTEYLKSGKESGVSAPEKALLHQKYMNHVISEFKPVLAEIIRQGIEAGEIHFDRPEVLAEIVLIVLTVKMDNTIVPSSKENIEETIEGLVALLEKGTDNPSGSLNFLLA